MHARMNRETETPTGNRASTEFQAHTAILSWVVMQSPLSPLRTPFSVTHPGFLLLCSPKMRSGQRTLPLLLRLPLVGIRVLTILRALDPQAVAMLASPNLSPILTIHLSDFQPSFL